MTNARRLALAGVLLGCSSAGAQPSIVIAGDTIVVAGKPLSVTVKRLLSTESPELTEALLARRAQAPEENPCGQIQVPGGTTFALIGKVLAACTTAGLTSIGLRETAAQPIVAVTTAASPDAKVPIVLKVTATDLRLIVAGAVTGPFATGMLLEKVKAMRAGLPGQLAITVEVEESVPFASVRDVLEICTRGGLSQLTLKGSAASGVPKPEPTKEAAAELAVQGALDQELIRKVVLSNQAQVRACYEKVLAGFPKLDGKVSLKFSISADGSVRSAVAESTSNLELSGCISDRVKTWVFPKPREGGVVVVTYPFTFTLK
ncbi:MAG: domain/TonB protein [Myxococcaceae bacterium]|nr:domain/TonB protein [Myxococcaceae bacterium]